MAALLALTTPAMKGASLQPLLHATRAQGPITIDGNLDDEGWKGALVFDKWYETSPGDNVEPKVKTIGYLTYDDRFLYVAIRCFDPDPREIRAQYRDRDGVSGNTDDAVAVVLDTHNDGKTGLELFVSASGTQGDAIENDVTGAEDFSPDFFWDSAVKIDGAGWSVEYRIPFSSLRYSDAPVQTWGIVLYRNRPRDRRYENFTSPLPRGTNCFVCNFAKVTGLEGLPAGEHVVVAPYVTGKWIGEATSGAGTPVVMSPAAMDRGADLKWIPNPVTAVDATIRPDFSQVESDVAAISTNQRFAIFNTEKRPFFLEGTELLDTPIQAVYTRTITAPRWGLRTTGKAGNDAYTILVAEDRGGGSVILPSPTGSSFADQDFSSKVAIARLRQEFGNQSFLSVLATTREIDGGGHDRVLGPDFQWRPSDTSTVTGQILFSNARTPDRPDLAPEWDGRTLSSRAGFLSWKWSTRKDDLTAQYKDIGHDFRADDGFVTQVGIRSAYALWGHTLWPSGFFSRLRGSLVAQNDTEQHGTLLERFFSAGLDGDGRLRSNMSAAVIFDRVRSGTVLLDRRQLQFAANFTVSRVVSQINVSGTVGQDVDFHNSLPGHGADISLGGRLRPTSHLQVDLTNDVRWLEESPHGQTSRLFTAQVERVRAEYAFTSRSFVRAIVQNTRTNRNLGLYGSGVTQHDGALAAQLLFAYKVNWQSVLFVGFGDVRDAGPFDADLRDARRQFFVKISRAFLR